jgi:hypothetical protein
LKITLFSDVTARSVAEIFRGSYQRLHYLLRTNAAINSNSENAPICPTHSDQTSLQVDYLSPYVPDRNSLKLLLGNSPPRKFNFLQTCANIPLECELQSCTLASYPRKFAFKLAICLILSNFLLSGHEPDNKRFKLLTVYVLETSRVTYKLCRIKGFCVNTKW